MKMEIIKDGEVQGSYVALAITAIIFIITAIAFFVDSVTKSWNTIGGTVTALYLGQFTAWLAYRGATAIWAKDVVSPAPVPPAPPDPLSTNR